jgi:hypothetical protein
LLEHLPTTNVTAGSQWNVSYITYSGSGTKYMWRWSNFDSGLLTANLRDAETSCTLLGGHLLSLHSTSQAEHLLGVYNSLWPRTSGWSYQVDMWLGFFAHFAWQDYSYCINTEETQGWGQYNYYGSDNLLTVLSQDPDAAKLLALVMAKKSPRAWSDWSAPDYPGMISWSPQCEGRVLNVSRETDPARAITTYSMYRGSTRQYVCACKSNNTGGMG